ncbi:MAG: hypothetical protein LBJ35_01980 [Spirochaetaceae bacterium]|nr:hypothetical protein [Spirochaetaceae bacterium]
MLIRIFLASSNRCIARNSGKEEKNTVSIAQMLMIFPATYNDANALYLNRSSHKKNVMSGNNASGAPHTIDEKK